MDRLVYDEEHHKLAVMCEESDWSEPVLRRWYWEIWSGGKSAAECYALGHGLQRRRTGESNGQYVYSYDPSLPPGASRTVFMLKDGGRTQAYRIDSEPIPAPKVRKGIETRWKDGHWQKYLKAEGWVRA